MHPSTGRRRDRTPIGVLLAGGEGRRLGGDKAWIELGGEPIARRALRSLAAVVDTVVVSCRLGTQLPPLPGVAEAWVQREGPAGPAAGLASALREARGRPILALAISLPLMSEEALRALASTGCEGRPAVLPLLGGRLEPLAGRWEPSALHNLETAAGAPLEALARSMSPATVPFAPDDPAFVRVDAPEDVLRAGAILDARRRRSRLLA